MGKSFKDSVVYHLEPEKDVDRETGLIIEGKDSAVNRLPFAVHHGCILRPLRSDVRYKVYFYRPEIPDDLIHTYTYHPEANWTTYCPELSDRDWVEGEHVILNDGYLRIAVSLQSAGEKRDKIRLQEYIGITEPKYGEQPLPEWMNRCCNILLQKTAAVRQKNDLTLLLLADTHYTVGGIWPDTLQSMKIVAKQLHPDALVHLGDFTDGLLPISYTRCLSEKMLSELKAVCKTLWCCVGNHDRNYFRGNPNRMSAEECSQLYLGREIPWYYIDCPDQKLRLLFLDSFDPEEKERYGFPTEEVRWVRRTLRSTPKSYRVLVFSHVPPVAEIHVWSDTIRNEERLFRVLERFHTRRDGAVLGWIHGHSHADQIYEKRCFPVIGVGCSKLEDFPEHKPEGSVTYKREQHTATQELWDVLLVHTDDGSLDFLRFGAGEDRFVKGKKHA